MSMWGLAAKNSTSGISGTAKMKSYWTYRCDHGHSWTIFRDEDAVERADDGVCPFGHEAVTLSKHRLINAVQVSMRPAGRVVDPVKGQIGHEYEFHIVITDLHREVERMSARTYSWSQTIALADRFRNVPANVAWQFMDELDTATPATG